MAAKTQITNKGLELLASSSKATGQHWWIGWYALAFVPDELQDESGEKLGPNMTKLTEEGDIIYNIFQGDMNGDGYQTTKASDKFKAVNYDSNIKKNYRYVLDEDGRNNLVTFVDGKNGLKGACVYPGVKVNESRDDNSIDYAKSKIPLPAPLLYTGVLAAGEGWSTNGMNIFLGTGNDRIENFYPVDKDSSDLTIPRVSADFRNYEGYKNGLPDEIEEGGEQGYAYALTDITDEGVDFDGWFPSVNTYTQNDDPTMDYNQFCRQYWKVLSISNFNKYCAPVNASGLLYDENTGCRNMAKATKYFPISDYSVTSTAKTADNEYATGIKLKVQLKLNGNAEDGAYFKDVEMADEENVATLNPEATQEEHQLFNTKQVSFKFNRIGIYAVPMRQYGCSDDSSEMKAQYQIDTEAEPVLFAVCEWDSPVTLSDSGEGLSEFQSDVFIDLSAAVDDSSVIRESAVFYNLYEDDAIDWYKNQLLANASMAEALVNMQIEMGYLRNQKNAKQGCCPKQEAIQQNSKSVAGLRNLVDAKDYNSNSVRNRLAQEEGKPIEAQYSDIMPESATVGYPLPKSMAGFLDARKSTVTTEVAGNSEQTTSDIYSALYGAYCDPRYPNSWEDAEFDDRIYIDMAVGNIAGDRKATRLGGLWIRNQLYYELYTFIKPSTQSSSITYDYPDDADTNEFDHLTPALDDYFGKGVVASDSHYVKVIKHSDGTITTQEGTSPETPDYPQELHDITDFANELSRPIQNYETQREYFAHYTQGESSRDYTGYQFHRRTRMELPKIQLYQLNEDVFSDINKRIESTGWRIPTLDDWTEIRNALNSSPEKVKEIRAGSKWPQTGGTGGVYPLGGVTSNQGGMSMYIPSTPVIYLAIANDDQHVIAFDGNTFSEPISKTVPEREGSLAYVSILCVMNATKIDNGKPKYKLGDDSYALMKDSITEGSHNFNAGEKSIIFESANYNSIFGGLLNKVKDSDHNTVLNGKANELLGSVYSVVFGDSNVLKKDGNTPACRMLVAALNSVVSGGATSAIFAENSDVTGAYQSSILGDGNTINGVYSSRFAGRYSEISSMYHSDVLAFEVHHLPVLHLCRATITNDHTSDVAASLEYARTAYMHYSDFIGHAVNFLCKSQDDYATQIDFSRLALSNAGIIKTYAVYSDITAYNDGHDIDSWFECKTLESVALCYSTLKLCSSSITSNNVSSAVDLFENRINFCDITLAQSVITLAENASTGHNFNFGVMKLSHSILAQCDCSYVYESGTMHYLNSAKVHYATLVGNLISLSSNYIQNTHIYGSLTLSGNLENHIILGGLSGTSAGSNSSDSYISDFGSYILSNYHGYPMIWSMGGIGLYMNKMILGDKGLGNDSKSPEIGDVLTVVGVEGNLATVAWMPGGASGRFGTVHLELEFDFSHSNNPKRGDGDDYAKNPWQYLTNGSSSINVNGNDVTPGETAIATMNSYMPTDIQFKVEKDKLVLKNASSTSSYLIKGSARCDKVIYAIDEPGRGYPWGWKIWDTDAFYPYSLGDANSPCEYSAALRSERVSQGGSYTDLVRTIAFGYTTTATATGGSAESGDICSEEVGDLPQHLVCKWIVDISYRKM